MKSWLFSFKKSYKTVIYVRPSVRPFPTWTKFDIVILKQ